MSDSYAIQLTFKIEGLSLPEVGVLAEKMTDTVEELMMLERKLHEPDGTDAVFLGAKVIVGA